jgi:hypothetical protein
MMSVVFASQTITLPKLYKKGDCTYFKNVMSGTVKHVLVRKVRGNSFVVYATDKDCTSSDQNCTYGVTFSIHCKEFFYSFLKLQY